MRKHEVRTEDDFRSFLRNPDRDWSRVILLGLDLLAADLDHALLIEELDARASFLGCRMSAAVSRKLASLGALVVPGRPGLEFDPFRTTVYDSAELLRGYRPQEPDTYRTAPDWRRYLSAMDPVRKVKRDDLGIDDAVFLRVHDLAIEDALDEYLKPQGGGAASRKRVVGIMGGHDRERLEKVRDESGAPTDFDAPYMQIAVLARRLAIAGFTVATGGGPGAMEAANLGAWFASRADEDLRTAVRMLERVPRVKALTPGSPEWNSGEWLAPAFEVMERFPRDRSDARTESVGVPTWFYGHEPPNPFASHIAKFFENSIREEGVLAIATHGVIFAEGNAGTVQEIFQDACQNYYATHGAAAPMVLMGVSYWNRAPDAPGNTPGKSVWPLLRQLGAEKGFAHLLLLSDDLDEIVTFIRDSRHV